MQWVGLFVCSFVCLSACISGKPHGRISPNFWPWFGPPLTALRYVLYFRFCGWCHDFIRRANASESSTSLCFEKVRRVAVPWPPGNDSVWWSSSECGKGIMSAISNWLVVMSFIIPYFFSLPNFKLRAVFHCYNARKIPLLLGKFPKSPYPEINPKERIHCSPFYVGIFTWTAHAPIWLPVT